MRRERTPTKISPTNQLIRMFIVEVAFKVIDGTEEERNAIGEDGTKGRLKQMLERQDLADDRHSLQQIVHHIQRLSLYISLKHTHFNLLSNPTTLAFYEYVTDSRDP